MLEKTLEKRLTECLKTILPLISQVGDISHLDRVSGKCHQV
jgi:hypothetical protein